MTLKESKAKLTEITRSFSYKKVSNLGNYQSETVDFFCSQKAEVPESDAEKTSEELYQFCKKEVVKSINEFKENGLLETQAPKIPVSQEDPEGWKKHKEAAKHLGEDDSDFARKEAEADNWQKIKRGD